MYVKPTIVSMRVVIARWWSSQLRLLGRKGWILLASERLKRR